jgi:sec-independent protein translocase protein TatC
MEDDFVVGDDDESVMFRFGSGDEGVRITRGSAKGESSSSSSSSSASSTPSFKTSLTNDPAFGNESASAVPTPAPAAMRSTEMVPLTAAQKSAAFVKAPEPDKQREQVRSFLYPGEEELPDDVEMTIWEHLEELRERALVSAAVVGTLILVCFCFAKDLTIFLEEPVKEQGVRFLQLGPGEYFFTTVKVAGYTGLLAGAPVVLYEAIAYVLPGLTLNERKTLGPIVLGSSVLFYGGIAFAYAVLVPAALKFFVGYAEGAVESLWSIDQYFEFVLVLLFSTGLSFQVPVIQLLLGQAGIVSSKQMLSVWRYVVVGSVVAAAVLTPSTDPFTQLLLAAPLMSLYLGGAWLVGLTERDKDQGGAMTMK